VITRDFNIIIPVGVNHFPDLDTVAGTDDGWEGSMANAEGNAHFKGHLEGQFKLILGVQKTIFFLLRSVEDILKISHSPNSDLAIRTFRLFYFSGNHDRREILLQNLC